MLTLTFIRAVITSASSCWNSTIRNVYRLAGRKSISAFIYVRRLWRVIFIITSKRYLRVTIALLIGTYGYLAYVVVLIDQLAENGDQTRVETGSELNAMLCIEFIVFNHCTFIHVFPTSVAFDNMIKAYLSVSYVNRI